MRGRRNLSREGNKGGRSGHGVCKVPPNTKQPHRQGLWRPERFLFMTKEIRTGVTGCFVLGGRTNIVHLLEIASFLKGKVGVGGDDNVIYQLFFLRL
jgi:hypothetical protein